MRFPEGISVAQFLRQHWQREPLHLPDAIGHCDPLLEADELAWLATLDDVESRLIFTEHDNDQTRYRVETGPFSAKQLAALPGQGWTILVQDVEKHLPDMRSWFAHVAFIPDWRIDDLMISFASPGGSVGPHRDNYDVFLCQVTGARKWQIATSDEAVPSTTSGEFSLLEPFASSDPIVATAGDVLYLPPGVPHWGIAETSCLTYSIGLRAPTVDELRCTFDRLDVEFENPFPSDDNSASIFYADADLDNTESSPGRISDNAVSRCRNLLRTDAGNISDTVVAATLGCTVTDLKPWLDPDPCDPDDIDRKRDSPYPVHGMARLAWCMAGNDLLVFANGRYCRPGIGYAEAIRSLCTHRAVAPQDLSTGADSQWWGWLLEAGVFDLQSNG